MKQRLVVATTNPGKVKELVTMLGDDFDIVGLDSFEDIVEVVEDGETFAQNARKKALGYASQTGQLTIADDSGLVVDAIDGAPGVKSARFSGAKDANRGLLDHKNMKKVLELMDSVADEDRSGRFMCCLCVAKPGEVIFEADGSLEGMIIRAELGDDGFGYDPIFYVPSKGKTVAQMSALEKNAISHRGNALRKLKALISELV